MRLSAFRLPHILSLPSMQQTLHIRHDSTPIKRTRSFGFCYHSFYHSLALRTLFATFPYHPFVYISHARWILSGFHLFGSSNASRKKERERERESESLQFPELKPTRLPQRSETKKNRYFDFVYRETLANCPHTGVYKHLLWCKIFCKIQSWRII